MRPVWLVVGVCALTLGGGWALKGQCLQPWNDFHQYSSLCYNDLQPLYGPRGIGARTFPYVEGDLVGGQLVDGAIEYPVLTGVFMWASGAGADTENEYLVQSAIALAPFGLLIAYLLADLTGKRALLWSASPAIVLYAFHNWDLLVVAAAVGGFWFWWRDRRVATAICFGIGGALKLYPLFFLVPLVIDAWVDKDKRVAARVGAVGLGVVALINLPFAVANFDGWWATFEFHRLRGPNFDNIWAVRDLGPLSLPTLAPNELNLVTALLTAGMFAGALLIGWRRMKDTGSYPFVQVCAALLAGFLLWNKVHSPQYALWILPFFVLLRVNVGWWVAYTLADLAVYVGVFRFFFDICSDAGCQMPAEGTLAQNAMNVGVFARAGLLAALFAIFISSSDHRVSSHPPDTVSESRGSRETSGSPG